MYSTVGAICEGCVSGQPFSAKHCWMQYCTLHTTSTCQWHGRKQSTLCHFSVHYCHCHCDGGVSHVEAQSIYPHIVTVMEVSPMLKPSQSYPPYCHCDGGVCHVEAQSILPSMLSMWWRRLPYWSITLILPSMSSSGTKFGTGSSQTCQVFMLVSKSKWKLHYKVTKTLWRCKKPYKYKLFLQDMSDSPVSLRCKIDHFHIVEHMSMVLWLVRPKRHMYRSGLSLLCCIAHWEGCW